MNVLSLSDPHYDFIQPSGGKRWLSKEIKKRVDFVVVAGDVANYAWAADDFFRIMARFSCPKIVVAGNHDLGYSKEFAYSDGYATQIRKSDASFFDLAKEHGFVTHDVTDPYTIVEIDGKKVLLFNLFYDEDVSDGEMQDTNDLISFDVRSLAKYVPIPKNPPQVDFSVSHMCPRQDANPKYPYHGMFTNKNIDVILRACRSPVHFFGHTHQAFHKVIDGVDYINNPIGYEIPLGSLDDFVVEI